jgi:N4-gp56 family major capsid protein
MAISFIPEIWSAAMLSSLKKAHVFGQPGVVNRNYEGDISMKGDTVRVRSMGRPTIGTYTKNVTTITPETLTDAQRALLIDQAKYFAFELDDIDAAQSPGGELEESLTEASYGLRDVADQFIAGKYTEAQADNQIGTVSVTSAALAYTQLRKLSVVLDEANVPDEGRWAIVPPWYYGLLLEDSKFVKVNEAGTAEGLRNGRVGDVLGFNVLKSNNCVNVAGDDYAVMAGHPSAISFAEQIVKVEAYRPEDSFSDAIKGLHVYGGKVMRPDSIATVVASIT